MCYFVVTYGSQAQICTTLEEAEILANNHHGSKIRPKRSLRDARDLITRLKTTDLSSSIDSKSYDGALVDLYFRIDSGKFEIVYPDGVVESEIIKVRSRTEIQREIEIVAKVLSANLSYRFRLHVSDQFQKVVLAYKNLRRTHFGDDHRRYLDTIISRKCLFSS